VCPFRWNIFFLGWGLSLGRHFLNSLCDESFLVRAYRACWHRLKLGQRIVPLTNFPILVVPCLGIFTHEFRKEDIKVLLLQNLCLRQDLVEAFSHGGRDPDVWHLVVELLKDKAHRAGQSAQVVILLGEGVVEGTEVSHPLTGKTAVDDINLVEKYHEWRLRPVKDRQGVHHVADERIRVLASDSVSHVERHGWEGARESLCDDLP